MKIIRLLSFTIAGAIITGSCSSGLTVSKRRYNKGFYVHHRNHVKDAVPEKNPVAYTEKNADDRDLAVQPVLPSAPSTPEVVKNNTQDRLLASARGSSKKSDPPSIRREVPAPLTAMVPQHMVKKLDKAIADRHARSDDAYSLIWLIIVVLAILYLIGLLNNSFGIGGIFHLLAVILVVLLILWLLKII